jgi:hypothetical protein
MRLETARPQCNGVVNRRRHCLNIRTIAERPLGLLSLNFA